MRFGVFGLGWLLSASGLSKTLGGVYATKRVASEYKRGGGGGLTRRIAACPDHSLQLGSSSGIKSPEKLMNAPPHTCPWIVMAGGGASMGSSQISPPKHDVLFFGGVGGGGNFPNFAQEHCFLFCILGQIRTFVAARACWGPSWPQKGVFLDSPPQKCGGGGGVA